MPHTDSPEKEARKALNRLRRALEKSQREMDALEGAIRGAEGADFPRDDYLEARQGMERLLLFLELEERRLREKLLAAGGLEAGRIRRATALD